MSAAPQTSLIPQIITLMSVAFDNKYARHFRMAKSIIEITQKTGECLPQDLLGRGYSKTEVDERWHLANAMANVELRLLNNESLFLKQQISA